MMMKKREVFKKTYYKKLSGRLMKPLRCFFFVKIPTDMTFFPLSVLISINE